MKAEPWGAVCTIALIYILSRVKPIGPGLEELSSYQRSHELGFFSPLLLILDLTGVQDCARDKVLLPLKTPCEPIFRLLDYNFGDEKPLLCCADSIQSICFPGNSIWIANLWGKECFTTFMYLYIRCSKGPLRVDLYVRKLIKGIPLDVHYLKL